MYTELPWLVIILAFRNAKWNSEQVPKMAPELVVFRLGSRSRQTANIRFKSLAISQIWKWEEKNSPNLFLLMNLAWNFSIHLDVINTKRQVEGKLCHLIQYWRLPFAVNVTLNREPKIEVFRHFLRTSNVKRSRDQALDVRFAVWGSRLCG